MIGVGGARKELCTATTGEALGKGKPEKVQRFVDEDE